MWFICIIWLLSGTIPHSISRLHWTQEPSVLRSTKWGSGLDEKVQVEQHLSSLKWPIIRWCAHQSLFSTANLCFNPNITDLNDKCRLKLLTSVYTQYVPNWALCNSAAFHSRSHRLSSDVSGPLFLFFSILLNNGGLHWFWPWACEFEPSATDTCSILIGHTAWGLSGRH